MDFDKRHILNMSYDNRNITTYKCEKFAPKLMTVENPNFTCKTI